MLTATRRRQAQDGFTVVEVLVALMLFGLVAAATVPLLAISGSAAVSTRSHTRAKNLAQERVEQMRQLPFQVDTQNGPFVDLLDYYYPNLTAAASSSASGWVSSSSTARVAGEPATGSFYRTRFATLAGQPGFSQTVAVQFLDFSRNAVPDTRFAGYRHDVEGLDGAPSTLLGVTVLTYWTHAGKPQSFRTFTQIGNTGDTDGLLISQASAVALRLESALGDAAGSAITAELLSVTADGRLSDGSVASVKATAARATRTGAADLVAANAVAVDPPNCQGSSCPTNQPAAGPVNSGACGYASFGRTRVDDVTATTADGLPRVPANVDGAALPTRRATATLLREAGHSCGAMSFDNTEGAGSSALRLAAGQPVVSVVGTSDSTGNTPIATSEAWVNATDVTASPRRVVAASRITGAQNVRLFPTAEAPEGVLKLQLSQASISCDSSAVGPSATYTVSAMYWDAPSGAYLDLATQLPSPTSVTWTHGQSGFINPFASVPLASRVVFAGSATEGQKTLADYIDHAPVLATAVATDSTNGLASIGDAVMSLTTKPVRDTDPASSIGLKMGKLSCVAVDQR